jgi:peroxiredoxin
MKTSEGASSPAGRSPLDKWLAFPVVTLLLSVGLNILLARKVRLLVAGSPPRVSEPLLKEGSIVQPITAKRLGGQMEAISYGGRELPTVLYVFTPQCSWCARNLDNFKALIQKSNHGYRLLGLSLTEDGLAHYVAKNNLAIPVYFASKDVQKAYQLGVTPQTLVISPEGRVLKDWAGAYAGQQKSQIEDFFGVKLPGLRSSS